MSAPERRSLPIEDSAPQAQAEASLLEQALNMPWAAHYETRRVIALPYIRLMFALHGVRWGRNWRIWGMPIIQRFRGSRIELGDGLQLRSWRATNPLVPVHPVVLATRSAEAVISIGSNTGLTGATIVAARRVELGNGVLVGANATIVDTDFHPLHPARRRVDPLGGACSPVIIEDEVFIGMNSIIVKGVHIGYGAVIGAGSVVTQDIPPLAVAAGNPARIIRRLDGNDPDPLRGNAEAGNSYE